MDEFFLWYILLRYVMMRKINGTGSGVPTEETEDETGDYGYPMDNLFADYM